MLFKYQVSIVLRIVIPNMIPKVQMTFIVDPLFLASYSLTLLPANDDPSMNKWCGWC
jgi:hypothetical protein